MSDVAERIRELSTTIPETSCIWWIGSNHSTGYGGVWLNGKVRGAHRVVYELEHGPIPDGFVVRHKCDNRKCINPDHLELGTHRDNANDCINRGRHHLASRTHCPSGHEFNEENTIPYKGARVCRTCKQEANRRSYIKKLKLGKMRRKSSRS
ncbi:HNH endonuclease signature motif containing protein [Parahaliea mediterranea]|uniref:HNH endonuclease signature motif containing protein n=1 Tax=Parahaliea mediterranea TaxID=651086 RepID=UPI000E2E9265